MAAPTQEFPPWLTPSDVVVTDTAGVEVASTTVVYLPLTYKGPSIDLGPLYTYGGYTYPATIVTGTATATASSEPPSETTLSATPTTLTTSASTISASSATPISSTASSSSLSLSSSVLPTTPTLTFTPSFTSTHASTSSRVPTGGPSSGATGALTRGQLVGVIVASILGLIFLLVFLLAMWLWCKGRRGTRSAGFTTMTPIDEDYYVVGEDVRTPGEGSPRHSGEEADPFLQRSQPPQGMQYTGTEMGSRPGVPRVPVPPPLSGSLSSSNSSSNASGYGVLLERPTLRILPSTAEETDHGPTGHHLSEAEMQRLNQESVLPQEGDDEYTGAYAIAKDPLLPPPRLVDPERAFGRQTDLSPPLLPFQRRPARESVASQPSLNDAEDAALLTARRVKVGDLPGLGLPEAGPSSTRGGFLDAIGLANLSNLSRMSWFKGDSAPAASPRQSRYSPTFAAVPFSDADVESGRAVLRTDQDADSFGRHRDGTIGFGPDGNRPSSHVSGTTASGGTVWHDAPSSLPGTPGLAAPPRALTPSDVPYSEHAWLSGQQPPSRTAPTPSYPLQPPPAYEDPFGSPPPPPPSSFAASTPVMDDILDMPAPAALTHFASSSSMPDSGTVSSVGLSRNPYPPGLEFGVTKHTKNWSQDGSLSVASSSPAWQQLAHDVRLSGEGEHHSTPVTIDVLEEEPPNAGETWRTMATGGGFGELSRRTTFGMPQIMHPGFIHSEQGSLHSMRSHVNPPSTRSSGSASASRRDASGSLSSNSSRPSVGSATSSIANSLVRSGSIISDGRRRFDPRAGSPSPSGFPGSPLSAFANRGFHTPPPPRVATPADVGLGIFKHGDIPTVDGSGSNPNAVHLHASTVDAAGGGIVMPPSSAYISPDRASTIRTVTSGSTVMGPDGRARTLSAETFATMDGRARTISAATFAPADRSLMEDLPFTNPALMSDWTTAL